MLSASADTVSAPTPASPSGPSGARRTAGRGPSGEPRPSTSSAPCRPTAELPEGVCEINLDALAVELPRGFGRD